MTVVTEEIASVLGIVTYVDYGETVIVSNRYYDEEIDGATTGFGHFFMVLTFATAIRVGMAVSAGKLSGNVSWNGNFMLVVILIALLIYGITNQIIYEVLELHHKISGLLDLLLGAGIAYCAYKYFQTKKREEGPKSNW